MFEHNGQNGQCLFMFDSWYWRQTANKEREHETKDCGSNQAKDVMITIWHANQMGPRLLCVVFLCFAIRFRAITSPLDFFHMFSSFSFPRCIVWQQSYTPYAMQCSRHFLTNMLDYVTYCSQQPFKRLIQDVCLGIRSGVSNQSLVSCEGTSYVRTPHSKPILSCVWSDTPNTTLPHKWTPC